MAVGTGRDPVSHEAGAFRVGDDHDVGDRTLHTDSDLVEMGWRNLREERKAKRFRLLPTPENEVIELD
jgi:hypothetical protein